MIAYALLVIFLPRLYLGLHFLSDIVGGALVGVLAISVVNVAPVRNRIGLVAAWAESKYRREFYGLAFLASYLLATMADDLRRIYGFVVH